MWHNDNKIRIKETAKNLSEYLNQKLEEGYTKPIFVLSHLPLYKSLRTEGGDAQYANHLFYVLNKAGEQGLNIFFLSPRTLLLYFSASLKAGAYSSKSLNASSIISSLTLAAISISLTSLKFHLPEKCFGAQPTKEKVTNNNKNKVLKFITQYGKIST